MDTVTPEGRHEDPLIMLGRCDGYYECPKNAEGVRLGPLAGYAGTYTDDDGNEKHWVGDVYANFAQGERHAPVLSEIGRRLYRDHMPEEMRHGVTFCGAPEGGKALAVILADLAHGQYIFPEKKVTKVASAVSREESKLVFDRHEPEKGDRVVVVEDVMNNVSTTAKLVAMIEEREARVLGVVCFLNRSLKVDTKYSPREGLVLPVVALVRKPTPQYKQDDPEVAEDIRRGNIVWKPKNEWPRMKAAMALARA